VTECLNHLAILEKLKAVHHNLYGMHYAEEANVLATEHNTERKLVLRALMSLANSAGLFEKALKWGREALPLFTKDADKADILAHIATFELRTGDIETAVKTIEEAKTLMEKGYETQGEPHRSIWKSKILLTKAIILFNSGDNRTAKECFEEGYEIAKKQNLKTRIAKAEALKPLFEEGSR
jgi:tetratricopeptide (TPR) repeat protein